jgi:LDH2 family malate/lactate/ureidoglycolate dehydrogenase
MASKPGRRETAVETLVAVPAQALLAWMNDAFAACGVPRDHANMAASTLWRTSLRGVDTHGVARMPPYLDKLLSGETPARAVPHITRHAGGVLHVDAGGSLGQVAATLALREAMAQARHAAVVACSLHNCGHLSALGVLLLEAAEQGFVAYLCQKTSPVMSLPGANKRAIGNNPMAFAAPVKGQPPLVFDIATSVAAFGNITRALQEGRRDIPAGWAIDPHGQPTTDAQSAYEGALLPMAGHKGIGLAMMVECLAGSMAGELQPVIPAGPRGSGGGVSAFLLVLNPELFAGRDAFDLSILSWVDHYLKATGTGARYPGLRQAECELERLAQGVPVPPGLLQALRASGEKVGRPFDLVA